MSEENTGIDNKNEIVDLLDEHLNSQVMFNVTPYNRKGCYEECLGIIKSVNLMSNELYIRINKSQKYNSDIRSVKCASIDGRIKEFECKVRFYMHPFFITQIPEGVELK